MLITPIKTHKIIPHKDTDLFAVLDKYLMNDSGQARMTEGSVLAVTSKIVSICEGRIVPIEGTDKDELIRQESHMYLPRAENKYNVSLTITNDMLVATAGIDESNTNGYYVLWPKDPQNSANTIRAYLRQKFGLKNLGVIITDSKTTPLRWGVTGVAVSHSGFLSYNNHIGKPDLFGRMIEHTMVSVMDSLASAAVYVMGERDEQTPLAIVSDIPHVQFLDEDPSEEEMRTLHVSIDDDLYGAFLKNAAWKKGEK